MYDCCQNTDSVKNLQCVIIFVIFLKIFIVYYFNNYIINLIIPSTWWINNDIYTSIDSIDIFNKMLMLSIYFVN